MREEKKEEPSESATQLSIEEVLVMKRDPSRINDTYQPRDVEKYWYQFWEERKFFHANPEKAIAKNNRYVMVLPPPKYYIVNHTKVLQATSTWGITECEALSASTFQAQITRE
jgi:hypothetical protein